MEKWVCSHCRSYQKVNPSEIKSGRKVFFFNNSISVKNVAARVNQMTKGVVLTRRKDLLSILVEGKIFKVKDVDVYPENTPTSLVYNMFGVCKC
ncbi:hypothetical protein AS4_14740 [Acinetobacter guillouiae]|uniref:hypothetical protein n=1 Tax=Acinetobacter guillouiae TaxID=106649 RepID=UPI0004EF64BA|nr:hypothetical protein [Acinetobacter guillouiae]BAP36414.1 hypothetical protein AS4_14740 [Acinetobacter guillouiae]